MRNTAFDEGNARRREFELFADRYAKALFDELEEVFVDRSHGDACHREIVAIFVFRPCSQYEVERFAHRLGIVEKTLVEIAHPKEENCIWILFFGVEILVDHRGQLRLVPLKDDDVFR